MDNFKQFADAINKRFLELSATGKLFRTNTPKDQLWATYQNAYSPTENPIFRERRVHECNTCYSFIKNIGAVVAIIDDQLATIWDVPNLPAPYDKVSKSMHNLVVNSAISSIFLTDERLAGKEYNIEENEAGNIRWDHFYADIDQAFISTEVATLRGQADTAVAVFNRALTEFSLSALETVEDLCDIIYRGVEFKSTVSKFITAKKAYDIAPNKTIFLWSNYNKYPASIRNSAIGTLIININEGMELDTAVRAYETVVAPSNYKRTSAVVTPAMKKQAMATIETLGLRESLPRRHARITDISTTDVLFSSATASAIMLDPLEAAMAAITAPTSAPKSSRTISIDSFLTNILPNSSEIEVLVENKHTPNFVSLVAPVNPEAPNMLKWNNNFSWSYNGEVTDSMKERVKAAGGKVDGVLRFSIQWNEDKQDQRNDLDAHCTCPDGHISYCNKKNKLDVDIRRPGTETAVENITWATMSDVRNGTYKFYVNDFSGNNTKGFRAQVEFNGQIFEYDYSTRMPKNVIVAIVTVTNGKFSIEHFLPTSASQKVEWDVKTLEYRKVSAIMLSPNFWNDQSIGNKHFFFMLEGCKNPDSVRGFYNEFLSDSLRNDRKVFEMLSSVMKCEPDDDQLSGLGFSSTQRNELNVKVDNVPYLVKF